jgi:hypothetical protein
MLVFKKVRLSIVWRVAGGVSARLGQFEATRFRIRFAPVLWQMNFQKMQQNKPPRNNLQ